VIQAVTNLFVLCSVYICSVLGYWGQQRVEGANSTEGTFSGFGCGTEEIILYNYINKPVSLHSLDPD
jgi:hypothetical protein